MSTPNVAKFDQLARCFCSDTRMSKMTMQYKKCLIIKETSTQKFRLAARFELKTNESRFPRVPVKMSSCRAELSTPSSMKLCFLGSIQAHVLPDDM